MIGKNLRPGVTELFANLVIINNTREDLIMLSDSKCPTNCGRIRVENAVVAEILSPRRQDNTLL